MSLDFKLCILCSSGEFTRCCFFFPHCLCSFYHSLNWTAARCQSSFPPLYSLLFTLLAVDCAKPSFAPVTSKCLTGSQGQTKMCEHQVSGEVSCDCKVANKARGGSSHCKITHTHTHKTQMCKLAPCVHMWYLASTPTPPRTLLYESVSTARPQDPFQKKKAYVKIQ